jgi:hypothetical protein
LRVEPGGAAGPEPVEGAERHRLRQPLAKADNFGRDVVAVTRRQQQTIADANMSAEPIDIDHEAGQSAHAPFNLQRGDVSQPGPTCGPSLQGCGVSH